LAALTGGGVITCGAGVVTYGRPRSYAIII
jgi:hypothetical protein